MLNQIRQFDFDDGSCWPIIHVIFLQLNAEDPSALAMKKIAP